MIVAGIGCRKGASAMEIETAIAAALAKAGVAAKQLDAIAAPAAKAGEAGIAAAAIARGVKLVLVSQSDLVAAGVGAVTHSERVMALTGVPSVAECAALAATGAAGRLILARLAVGPATCALAIAGEPS
jgi:cobalt-precorrin 5A hydrolase